MKKGTLSWLWNLKLVFPFRLIEPINLEKAVDLYQKAAGVFEVRTAQELHQLSDYVLHPHTCLFCVQNEDRLRQAVELLGKASRLLVRLKRSNKPEPRRFWLFLPSCKYSLQNNPGLLVLWFCLVNQAGRGCNRSAEGEEHVQRDWELPDVFQGAATPCFAISFPLLLAIVVSEMSRNTFTTEIQGFSSRKDWNVLSNY